MNTLVKEPEGTALFVHPNPMEVLLSPEKFEAFYQGIVDETKSFIPDITTQRGRDAIKVLAFKVTRTKTYLDGLGKDLNETARAQINKVDASRRAMRDRLDALKDDVRRPLTEWEEAEHERTESIASTMSGLREAAYVSASDTPATIAARLEAVSGVSINAKVFLDETMFAEKARTDTIQALTAALERLKQEEVDRAELARLRAEKEERGRAEAERGAKEAAAKAETERLARAAEEEQRRLDAAVEAERRAAFLKAEAERTAIEDAHAAELRKAQKEHEATLAAEARRKAEETRLAAEQAARDADKAHRSSVMKSAKEAVIAVGDVTEDQAKKIVLAIVAGEVPQVSLRF